MTLSSLVEAAHALGAREVQTIMDRRAAARAMRPQTSNPPSNPATLVAQGDSWFDYPLHDILKILEDRHGYNIESVAHHGDSIETMAYAGTRLDDFSRRIEKVLRSGQAPRAILLSAGGDDIAGAEFGMLLNHARSAAHGLNASIMTGLVQERIRGGYLTILSAITRLCIAQIGEAIPILFHGYDYSIPDGRGFLGGWGWLPGPWLAPGFQEKGFDDLGQRSAIAREVIDQLNAMLQELAALPEFAHVHYLDLRGTLSAGVDYKNWWANELHPSPEGFARIADRFAEVLAGLPVRL